MNQAVLEAMYSVPYVETYLDVVENLPDEIQRLLTKIRELDVCYHAYIKEIETIVAQQSSSEDSSNIRKRNMSRIQVALIAAQEIGDEKLSILQQVQDIIENKTRQLDGIFCELPFAKAEIKKDADSGDINTKTDESTKKSSGENASEPAEPPKKRTRRKRAEIEAAAAAAAAAAAEAVEHTSATPLPRSSATIEVKKSSGTEAGVKKRKRKSKQAEKDVTIDPNEPTYCLCNQVSFGQMVMCDNDHCPIEWFHFTCVGITNTPKGKWYCPDCRKARSSNVRPKK